MRPVIALCAWWMPVGALAQTTTPPLPTVPACDDGLVYQTADAHPAIRWIVLPADAAATGARPCVLRKTVDDGSIEVKGYMSSGLYRFVRECRPDEATVHRVFEYRNPRRPYFLRWHPNPFIDLKTYIVVSSHLEPVGNYMHEVKEIANKQSQIKRCPPDEK